MSDSKRRVAVVAGRFQVPSLHEGHRHLLDYARERNDVLVIFIRTGGSMLSKNSPLPYEVREAMVREAYPNAVILKLRDHPSNTVWSEILDERLAKLYPDDEVLLYGSRDSFASGYTGRYNTVTVRPIDHVSSAQLREDTARGAGSGNDVRVGLCAAQFLRHDISYQTVDVGILMQDGSILVGRKPTDPVGRYRFIGGFVDPTDQSLERACTREGLEETDTFTANHRYLGSFRVDDWRYRNEGDKIMTSLFAADWVSGTPRAKDDIIEVRQFRPRDFLAVSIDAHRPLAERFVRFVETGK
jgi:bifunctional NMN adenylyltransferase/nudix hydrolase